MLYGVHEKNGFLQARFVGNPHLESLFLMMHTWCPPVRVGLGSRASVSLDKEVAFDISKRFAILRGNDEHTMILDDEEGDQVCLACYLSALTVYTLPAIHTRVVSRWRE